DVVTDGIVEVRANSVVTRDAAGVETEHEVDTIILGTGFHVTEPPVARRVFNSDGRSLADHWGANAQAFRGTTVSGFPNVFVLAVPSVARFVFIPDGRSLVDHWGANALAFRGTAVSGFPNVFVLAGPNTCLGHTSQVFMIEAQIRYTMQPLKYLCRNRLDRIDVRPKAQRRYNDMVNRSMEGTVWVTGGCDSWYLNEEGRNTTL